jgi:Glycosyl transferases group 1
MSSAASRVWRWQAQQAWQRVRGAAPFARAGRRRVLMLSVKNPVAQTQVFPFHFYAPELAQRLRVDLREVDCADYERAPERAPGGADVVCVQLWFDADQGRIDRLFAELRARNPNAKFVFLDSFAPADLRLAHWLDRHVDLYVKKHLFRDRARYAQPTFGDTNLVDFYSRLHGLPQQEHAHTLPEGFLRKLVVGPQFHTSRYLLPAFYGASSPKTSAPTIDVHARLAVNGSGWYSAMRQAAADAVGTLSGRTVLVEAGVKPAQYFAEMSASRVCFSPFGYGEICWRDYEAVVCGALLVKPDTAHLESHPDIFVDGQTYVSVRWDFADAAEKIDYWLRHDAARAQIVARAYERLHRYSRGAEFVDQVAPVLVG